jgi:phenylalanyl-tRNA synthetase beta chain
VQAASANLNVDQPAIAGFTVGKVFWNDGDKPAEAQRLAAVLCGQAPVAGLDGRKRAVDFLDIKGALEAVLDRLRILDRVAWRRPGEGYTALHPGKSAVGEIDGRPVAVVGVLHPETEAELGLAQPCWLFELDLERALDYVPRRFAFADLPRFPAVERDVAIVVKVDFASEAIVHFIRQWHPEVVERVALFDEYTGPPIPEGKKSLAYSIAYRAADRTLTDDEVNHLHAQLLADLTAAFPVQLR